MSRRAGFNSGAPPPRGRTPAADMRDAALKHMAELDPEAGRALILRDAMDGTASPSLSAIRFLPADDIAAVVKASVQGIGTASMRGLDYELLDRYADGSALSVVRKLVENPAMWGSCGSPQVYRYLLRVDPAYGAKLVTAALNSKKENACYKSLLQSLGDELPNVQDAAVKALDDPDQDLVLDALIALGGWGTAEAEAALWARLKRLHQEWVGREDQLRSTPDFKSKGSRTAALEGSLADAIAHGVGWLCPPEKLALLGDLVSTKAAKQQIEGWNKAGDWRDGRAVINAIWVPEDSPTFSVLQYGSLNEKQLTTKLAQFTSGTQLLWQFWKPGEISPAVTMEVQEATFERIRSIAEKHDVTLGKLNHP